MERNCCIFVSIQIIAYDSGTKGISVQPDHKIQDRCPVICLYDLFIIICTEHFFRKIERILISLFKRQTRIIFQILKFNQLFLCQRISLPEEYIDSTVKQLSKFHCVFLKNLLHHLPVKIIEIQNPDFTFLISYVLNNFMSLCLMNRKLKIIHPKILCHFNKGLDRKGIMLHGYTEFLFWFLFLNKLLFHQLILLQNLSCIPQKIFSFRCYGNPTIGS